MTYQKPCSSFDVCSVQEPFIVFLTAGFWTVYYVSFYTIIQQVLYIVLIHCFYSAFCVDFIKVRMAHICFSQTQSFFIKHNLPKDLQYGIALRHFVFKRCGYITYCLLTQ